MQIGYKEVGEGNPCYIIAEAGVNHNGDIKLAKLLIHTALEAGADAIKFQFFITDRLVSESSPKVGYQLKNTDPTETQYDMLQRLELSAYDMVELKYYCDKVGITFICTPFCELSAEVLGMAFQSIGAFKISSSEIINTPLIKQIASYNQPIIMSTGMCNLQEVAKALDCIKRKEDVALLHCVSNYPADPAQTNLKAMLTMKEAFKVTVGYSDHTPGITVPIAAVAMGASIIEKHFTLDRNMEGPDHKASLEPTELKEMVEAIRLVESALGDGIKQPTEEERETKAALRKSIVAKTDLSAGTVLQRSHLTLKRPGTGLPPKAIDFIVGMVLWKSVKENQMITKEDLK